MNKLVLFDIDGILVSSITTGATTRIFQKFFGLENHPPMDMEGVTQRKILFECLKNSGIKNPENDPRFEEALAYYATAFKESFAKNPKNVIPNVELFVKKLLGKGVTIGLLTGNTPSAAQVKLESVGLWKYFKFGAFGDKIMDRNKLVPVAIQAAKKETGIEFKKENTFVIGDTPKDIECAKAGKVRSIAIATGKYSLDELKKESPTYVFKDFSDTKAIMGVIIKD